MLVTSVVLFAQQIPSTSSEISEGSAEGLGLQDIFILSYITRSPIIITSNADFVSQGFPGNGTAEDPYVIAGYNITTTETCIGIRNTDAYFVIRDCLLKGEMLGGVHLRDVNHGEIRNNTILGGAYFGVHLQSSSDNIVVNNTISAIYAYGDGVYISSSSDNTLVNNTISGYDHGVHLRSSSDNTLSSNIFVNNGIYIFGFEVEYWKHNITTDNLVNGKPLGYFWNGTSGTIDGTQYGQAILANCTGVTVEDGVFINASVGIQLGYSSYCSLMNNILSGNDKGVYISFSSNNTLVSNSISGNSHFGVVLAYSSDNTLMNNNISGNHADGVYIVSSSNNTLVNNTISGNSQYGVHLSSSSNNTLVNNNISANHADGVYICFSSDTNFIYLNVIADNDDGNAIDGGTDNHWNITGRGNYWSDHTGTGVYHIPGGAGSIDYYPFIYPPETTTPTIDQPADIDYVEGTTGNTIIWTPSDAHPSHYVVYRNGTEVALASWDGSSITVEVDSLNVGTYVCRIVVYDTSGNWVSDTVLVIVLSQTTTTTTTTTSTTITNGDVTGLVILFLGVGGIGVVIAVLILMRHRRGSTTGS
jgi:parallel beta-helix repeat protein